MQATQCMVTESKTSSTAVMNSTASGQFEHGGGGSEVDGGTMLTTH